MSAAVFRAGDGQGRQVDDDTRSAHAWRMTDHRYWQQRWELGEIGFHQPDFHRYLVQFYDTYLANHHRIYVPLCGKTRDLVFLFERGHDVVGSELAGSAIAAFFDENQLVAAQRTVHNPRGDAFVLWEATRGEGRLCLIQGDALALDTDVCPPCDAVYDRAAAIALNDVQLTQHFLTLHRLMKPGSHSLLVTFDYDQKKIDGPPFALGAQRLAAHAPQFVATLLAEREEPRGPKFVAAGVDRIDERCLLLRRN